MVEIADDMKYYSPRLQELSGKIWGDFGAKVVSFFIIILQFANPIACILLAVEFME